MAGRSVRPFHTYPLRSTSATTTSPPSPGFVGDGLGDVGVERLVLQVQRLEALLAQLAEHDVEQRPDLVGMPQVGGLGGVEHRQHGLGQPPRGPVGLVADLGLDALAVVLEVGLQALGDVLVLVALLAELADLARRPRTPAPRSPPRCDPRAGAHRRRHRSVELGGWRRRTEGPGGAGRICFGDRTRRLGGGRRVEGDVEVTRPQADLPRRRRSRRRRSLRRSRRRCRCRSGPTPSCRRRWRHGTRPRTASG